MRFALPVYIAGRCLWGCSAKPAASNQLWTQRYAPQTLKEICGNKGQVEKLQEWLGSWFVDIGISPHNGLALMSVIRSGSLQCGFKKPGKNGMNIYRAVMVTGPPGIGKTTSAHLCAKLAGFTPIELNASDARSKKLVENSTNIMNASLDGWMHGGHVSQASFLLRILFSYLLWIIGNERCGHDDHRQVLLDHG